MTAEAVTFAHRSVDDEAAAQPQKGRDVDRDPTLTLEHNLLIRHLGISDIVRDARGYGSITSKKGYGNDGCARNGFGEGHPLRLFIRQPLGWHAVKIPIWLPAAASPCVVQAQIPIERARGWPHLMLPHRARPGSELGMRLIDVHPLGWATAIRHPDAPIVLTEQVMHADRILTQATRGEVPPIVPVSVFGVDHAIGIPACKNSKMADSILGEAIDEIITDRDVVVHPDLDPTIIDVLKRIKGNVETYTRS